MLSLTGFEGFDAEENAPEEVTAGGPALDLRNVALRPRGHQRTAVVTYTPPGSFPFRVDGNAGLTEDLKLTVSASGSSESWADPHLLLVRPPVVFVHGLTGNRDAFGDAFVDLFRENFISAFADYGSRSVSGFDTIFGAVPRLVATELGRWRRGDHATENRYGEVGSGLAGLQRKPQRIAATKVDIIAHSMGGWATRWYVTQDLEQLPDEPRSIQYPASSGLNRIAGRGFPAVSTARLPDERYRRPDNFLRGDIRKLVTTASPQLGSPIANYVTHEIVDDSRSLYANPVLQLAIRHVGWIRDYIPEGAEAASDFGTAVYDLAEGSSAGELAWAHPSAPVPVHAMASVKGAGATGLLADLPARLQRVVEIKRAILRGLIGSNPEVDPCTIDPTLCEAVPDLSKYCPQFGPDNSDLVVPLASALYGNPHSTGVEGLDHIEVNSTENEIATKISTTMLYDQPDGSQSRINNFNLGFPINGWPLNCQ
jgi:pimeloyl-ACP methyl ester carboxylesterase